MIKLFTPTLFIAVLLFNFLKAQTIPSIEWQKCLGGSGYDYGMSVQQTADDGFVITGYTNSTDGDVGENQGLADCWVVKLNATGDTLWTQCIGGSYSDQGRHILETTDGGLIISGWSESNDGDVSGNHGSYDYWVVKISTDGNIEWQKSLGGNSIDFAYTILQTTDGGYLCAGGAASNNDDVSGNHGSVDYWVVKLDSAGSIDWQKSLGGSNQDWANSVLETPSGDFIVAGFAYSANGDVSGNIGTADCWIARLDVNGNLISEKSFGGTDLDEIHSIRNTLDGGFIFAGATLSNDVDVSGNHGYFDCWIVKLDSAENIEWQKCLGGTAEERAYDIQLTTDSGYVVAGWTRSSDSDVAGNHGGDDSWIVKLDAIGNLEWQKCLGGSLTDWAYSIQQTFDDGFIVAGYTSSNDSDVSGNHGDYDCWIVKLSGNIPTGTSLTSVNSISVYPNPAQDEITINFRALGNEVSIYVYDMNGKIISVPALFSETKTQINISGLAGGFYAINIIEGKTGKIHWGKFVKSE